MNTEQLNFYKFAMKQALLSDDSDMFNLAFNKLVSEVKEQSKPKQPVIPNKVLKACLAYATAQGVLEQDLLSTTRKHPVVQVRQAVMVCLYFFTDESYPSIARMVNRKDHTTIIHAVKNRDSNGHVYHLTCDLLEQGFKQIKGV